MTQLDRYEGDSPIHFELVLDILDGCANHCAGCYVTRRNSVVNSDLALLDDLASGLISKGIAFDEFTLGPTDTFTATNFGDIVESAHFQSLMNRSGLTVSSTLVACDEQTLAERAQTLLNIADGKPDILLLCMLDVPRLYRDLMYAQQLSGRLTYLHALGWDIAFLTNYSGPDSLDGKTSRELLDHLHTLFPEQEQLPFRLAPSFLNVKKNVIVQRQYRQFKQLFEQVYEPGDHYVANHAFTHGAYRFLYKRGRLYNMPYLVDGVACETDLLAFPSMQADDVISKLTTDLAMQYATVRPDCAECEWLPACAERQIITMRDVYSLDDCPVPFGGSHAIAR